LNNAAINALPIHLRVGMVGEQNINNVRYFPLRRQESASKTVRCGLIDVDVNRNSLFQSGHMIGAGSLENVLRPGLQAGSFIEKIER
jgi:hypothetical protein